MLNTEGIVGTLFGLFLKISIDQIMELSICRKADILDDIKIIKKILLNGEKSCKKAFRKKIVEELANTKKKSRSINRSNKKEEKEQIRQ